MAVFFKKEGTIMSSADALLKKFQKDMGDTIGQKGMAIKHIDRIPTGVFPLDLALGGGIPRGRITIVHGNESCMKTGLSYLLMAQVQREGKKAVYIDLEVSFDPTWAVQFGLNLDELIYITPQYAEQCVDVVEGFLYADDVGIVVVDSIAAMTTDNEIASSAEKMNVGGASYIVGKMIRKAVIALGAQSGKGNYPALFCINQQRIKIGCFESTSPVWLADGTTMPIGKIVKNKLGVEVLSMAEDGTIVPRKVIGWAKNGIGTPDEWLKITVAGSNMGRRLLKVTKGHTIFTPKGEVLANTLKIGDLVTTEGIQYYSKEQHEVILGSILGDGSLRFEKGGTRGHLRVGHGPKQLAYNEYKASLFGKTVRIGKNCNEFCTDRSLEFSEYREISKDKGLLHIPQKFVDRLTLRSLAIWYLDDGNFGGSSNYWGYGKPTISTKTLDADSMIRVAEKLSSLGAGRPTIKVGSGFLWSGDRAFDFLTAIAPYVPKCMSYKVKSSMSVGSKSLVEQHQPELRIFSEPVVDIKPYLVNRQKYDITVEGNHNYMVNGVVVHNTMFGDPTTMPGGNSLKFAASLILKLYGKDEIIKEVNPAIATFKEVTGSVQKAKMPILSKAFEYKLTLIPHGHMKVGQCPSWTFVATTCKNYGMMTQAGQGKPWKLLDKEGATQKDLREIYESDVTFAQAVHQAIIDRENNKGVGTIIEEIDQETGEILNAA